MNRSAIVSIAIYLLSKKRLKDIHARFIYFCDTSAPVTSFPSFWTPACHAGSALLARKGRGCHLRAFPCSLCPFLTDVAVRDVTVGIIPQPAFTSFRRMKLPAVLSILSVFPVVWLTFIPETEHNQKREEK